MIDLYGVLNAIIRVVAGAVSAVIGLLPESPFQSITLPPQVATIMGYAAWFLPIHEAVIFLQALVVAVAVWYGIRWLMRFTRYI